MSWQCSKVQEHPKNFTYIVECSDGTLYTGWTNNLEHRVETHNVGKGAKYTKSRRPVKLVYFETYSSKEEAMRREWEIKQLSRTEKMEADQGEIKIKNRLFEQTQQCVDAESLFFCENVSNDSGRNQIF